MNIVSYSLITLIFIFGFFFLTFPQLYWGMIGIQLPILKMYDFMNVGLITLLIIFFNGSITIHWFDQLFFNISLLRG